MSNSERPESASIADAHTTYSMSNFFHDAYSKGLVDTAEAHHKEAAIAVGGAVVTVAALAAVTYMSRGRDLTGLFKSGVAEEFGSLPAGIGHEMSHISTSAFPRIPMDSGANEAQRAAARALEVLQGTGERSASGVGSRAGSAGSRNQMLDVINQIHDESSLKDAARLFHSHTAGETLASEISGSERSTSMFSHYDRINYRYVPCRGSASSLNLGSSPAVLAGREAGSLESVRFPRSVTRFEEAGNFRWNADGRLVRAVESPGPGVFAGREVGAVRHVRLPAGATLETRADLIMRSSL